MPQLLLFAPCSRTIEDRRDNTLSLISIINRLNAVVSKDAPSQERMRIDIPWTLVSVWRRADDEAGTPYEQRTRIIGPSGQIEAETVLPFLLQAATHRVTVNYQGFPGLGEGEYTIELALRRADLDDAAWETRAAYPLDIVYERADDAESD